ncbi:uncharacterized protein LOC122922767 [Bufo gargarizans]|uniref:uncharacterized protein LOC122922767 n=1 Tax=Bufo gargarizans TaxID=30331 RepID=UPI001CF1FE5B|nr:uncharacterized protein LOC122922767 [Bufo gargarizans]
MDLRPTVDSLDDDPEEDSDAGGSDTPAVFSPESSPSHPQAEEPHQPPLEPPTHSQGTLDPTPQPRPRRRCTGPQASSVPDTREQIDARVIEFLAKRRSEGPEEAVVRGLGPLLRGVPAHRFCSCVSGIAMLIELFSSPYEEDILGELCHVRRRILASRAQNVAGPSQAQPHGPLYLAPLTRWPRKPAGHRHNFTHRLPPMPLPQQQQRPGSSYQPGPFTRDLFEL